MLQQNLQSIFTIFIQILSTKRRVYITLKSCHLYPFNYHICSNPNHPIPSAKHQLAHIFCFCFVFLFLFFCNCYFSVVVAVVVVCFCQLYVNHITPQHIIFYLIHHQVWRFQSSECSESTASKIYHSAHSHAPLLVPIICYALCICA